MSDKQKPGEVRVEYWVVKPEEKEAVKLLQSRDYIVFKKNSGPAVVKD